MTLMPVLTIEIDEATASSEPEPQALGECCHCGTEFYSDEERAYHSDAECIGGFERFNEGAW